MRAGVRDTVRHVSVRQMVVIRISAEPELEHAHSRNLVLVTQSEYFGRDESEILGDHRDVAEIFHDRREKLVSGGLHPFAMLGCFILAGNFPASFETAEMIDTNDIDRLERPGNSCDPPTESVLDHRIPIINGIAPKLSGGRKEIRWDARDDLRRTIGIQLEFALIAPYIARIQRDEDRYVADDLYPF